MVTRRAPVFQWRLRLARHVAAPAASGDDEMDPQPRNTFNVAVIGAGLSGLCLAQSLKKSGIDVHVYERDDSAETRGQGESRWTSEGFAPWKFACLTASSHCSRRRPEPPVA